MTAQIQTTISPYTQQPILTRPLLSDQELDNAIGEAVKAGKGWKKVPVEERIAIAEKWLVSSSPAVRHSLRRWRLGDVQVASMSQRC
jgi:delta 1-pyrroline-5-carboxylate dehydrogenase